MVKAQPRDSPAHETVRPLRRATCRILVEFDPLSPTAVRLRSVDMRAPDDATEIGIGRVVRSGAQKLKDGLPLLPHDLEVEYKV